MFDFEKLVVYQKAKAYNKDLLSFIHEEDIDKITYNQLRRASFSIMLNIAEGTGRFTKRDRRNFYVISRGSVFECVAIFDYLHDVQIIGRENFEIFYSKLEQLSWILFGLIRSLE